MTGRHAYAINAAVILPLVFLSLYVGAQLAAGLWISRRVRNEADYLVAGRSLGPWMTSAGVFATWFGAEACVGAAGQVYAHGLGAAVSDPFGYGAALLVFGLIVAAPLFRRGLMTLADLFRQRFSAETERLVALMMIPGSLLWASAQMKALGHILAGTVGFDVLTALLIASAACILYTSVGGMLADAYTDLIQGGILVVSILTLGIIAFTSASSETLAAAFQMSEPREGSGFSASLEAWAIPIIGSLAAQELAAKSFAARSATIARGATIAAGIVYLIVGAIPVGLAAIARVEMPGIQEHDQIIALVAVHHLGEYGRLLFVGALLAAILSTVDSALLAAGGVFSRNLLGSVERKPAFSKLFLARASVAGFGLIALLFALHGESVHSLVFEASAFASAGIVVSMLFGLFTRFGGARAAIATLLSGTLAYASFAHLLELEAPYLSALALSAMIYLAVASWELTRGRAPIAGLGGDEGAPA